MADLPDDPKELRRLLLDEREAHARRAGELAAMQRADRRLREVLSAVSPLADAGWLADAPVNAAARALAVLDCEDPDIIVEVGLAGGTSRLPQWCAYLPQAAAALDAASKAATALSMGLGSVVADLAPPLTRGLGAATEALLGETFKSTLLITSSTAAALLGVDVKTLKAMTETGLIRCVLRGKLRAYTEADIRAYLSEGPGECRSTSTPRAPSGTTTSSFKVVGILDRQGRRTDAQRKLSRTGNGGLSRTGR